jgi:hypothetical protein
MQSGVDRVEYLAAGQRTSGLMSDDATAKKTLAETAAAYVWLIETSDDGNIWWWEHSHPVHRMRLIPAISSQL